MIGEGAAFLIVGGCSFKALSPAGVVGVAGGAVTPFVEVGAVIVPVAFVPFFGWDGFRISR